MNELRVFTIDNYTTIIRRNYRQLYVVFIIQYTLTCVFKILTNLYF